MSSASQFRFFTKKTNSFGPTSACFFKIKPNVTPIFKIWIPLTGTHLLTYEKPPSLVEDAAVMTNSNHSLYDLVQSDTRYPIDAYVFVHEALNFASESLELGSVDESAEIVQASAIPVKRHLTGQELCEAIRRYALNQFGYMSKVVLQSWGITSTSCFGDIVYNLIRIGRMEKSRDDKRDHFNNVYDFNDVFENDFRISSKSFAGRS